MAILYYQRSINKGDMVILIQDITVANHERRHAGQTEVGFKAGLRAIVCDEPFNSLYHVQLYSLRIGNDVIHHVPEYCIVSSK